MSGDECEGEKGREMLSSDTTKYYPFWSENHCSHKTIRSYVSAQSSPQLMLPEPLRMGRILSQVSLPLPASPKLSLPLPNTG